MKKYFIQLSSEVTNRYKYALLQAEIVGMHDAMEMFMSGEKERQVAFGSVEAEQAYKNGFKKGEDLIVKHMSKRGANLDQISNYEKTT